MLRFLKNWFQKKGLLIEDDFNLEAGIDPLLQVRAHHIKNTDPVSCRCRWCVAHLVKENKEMKNELDVWRKQALDYHGPYRTSKGVMVWSDSRTPLFVPSKKFASISYSSLFGNQFQYLDLNSEENPSKK